jgi:hypothetical protein
MSGEAVGERPAISKDADGWGSYVLGRAERAATASGTF